MHNSQILTLVLFASIMILMAPMDLGGQPVASPDNSKSDLPIPASPPVKENPSSAEPGASAIPGPESGAPQQPLRLRGSEPTSPYGDAGHAHSIGSARVARDP